MESNAKIIESLYERAIEYIRTSYELIRLKTLDKTTEVASLFITHFVVFVLFASFLLFLNLGLALWIGALLDNIVYGFLIVAAFHGFLVMLLHLFMRKWFMKVIGNYIIKLLLK